MLAQFLIGTSMIVITALFAGIGFLVVESMLLKRADWICAPPKIAKRMLILCSAVLWFMLAVFVAVSLWAALYLQIGVLADWEEAIYFSIVAYTTLGFGDILLPNDWRLLAGIEALNGLLMIGLQAAMLIEIMSRIRKMQNGSIGDFDQ